MSAVWRLSARQNTRHYWVLGKTLSAQISMWRLGVYALAVVWAVPGSTSACGGRRAPYAVLYRVADNFVYVNYPRCIEGGM